MAIHTELPDNLEEVDVIVVGGGTAGCAIASRIADSDAELRVLVIEQGSSNLDNPSIRHLASFWNNFAPGSTTLKFLMGKGSDHIAGRQIAVPVGRGLGGGSAVNMGIYSRAQRCDFDSWNMSGWSTDDMLPFMKKLETYHGPGPKDRHGYDGPIHVSSGTYRADRAAKDTLQALTEAGWSEIEDLANLDACNGGQRALRYVNLDGTRSDAASAYLHPRLMDGKHDNLHVLVESSVARIQLSDGRATRVVFRSNVALGGSANRLVMARKMVVVASGTCGSPAILERSGIGDPEVLNQAGVQPLVNLAGVGRAYQDHQLVACPYRSSLQPEETFEMAARIDPESIADHPMRGWNGIDITCKLRPKESHIASMGPEFQEVWARDYKNVPEKPMAMMAAYNGFPGDPTGLPPGQYFGHSIFTVYPFSRGHIHITGPSLDDPLDFNLGYFSDQNGMDILKCMWAYKVQREIARRRSVYRGEVSVGHPPFPAGSDAACIELDQPLSGKIEDIQYTPDDDVILTQWLKENVSTTWHSLGTCKMGSVEASGVVDETLSVHGVKGLKVADLSIAPENVGAHTNNTALAIGERAADLFIQELAARRGMP